ncbi:MAG: hypothetical protein EOP37_08905 [Rubrivivax sp.]|nr:MAG: hypothetical protein EOP37_08905 [Rubrivivax sp.]
MNPAWISQRVPLSGLALRIDDAEEEACPVVLKRESLAVVRSAGEVVRAARSGCAMRLRAARERERLWRQRARDQVTDRLALDVAELRAAALTDAMRIASALRQDREQLLAGAETLLIDIARHAARRLLLDLPAEVGRNPAPACCVRNGAQCAAKANPDCAYRLTKCRP